MNKTGIIFGVWCSLLFACNGNSGGFAGGNFDKSAASTDREMTAEAAPQDAASGESHSKQIAVPERKIIRTGHVAYETKSLANTRKLVHSLSQTYQCYIASDNQYRSGDRVEEEIVLRIPAAHFDTLLTQLEQAAGYFEQKQISSQDVTEEFMDIEARIKNKKALEMRYQQLLKSAVNVKEIMEVERQINEIREQIEQAEGRLKYLSNQTSFSTLTIRFYERTAAPRGWLSKFGQAFSQGWDGFVYFLVGIVYLWPFWIALAAIGWLLRRYWKGRRKSP